MRLGTRTLIAASCRRCGRLFPGSAFHYHYRNRRDKAAYIDQRCPNCKWGSRVKGKKDARTNAENDAEPGGRSETAADLLAQP